MPENTNESPRFSSRPLEVRLDGEGRFLEANEAYCNLFGRKAEELLGHWFMPLVHVEDRDKTEIQMQKLWSPPHVSDLKNRAMTVMGWRWLLWHAEAKLDDNGEVLEIHAFGRDVTDTKWQEPVIEEKLVILTKLLRDIEANPDLPSNARETLKHIRKLLDEIRSYPKISG